MQISDKMAGLLYAAATELLIPEIGRIIANAHAQNIVITEAYITAQLEARAAALLGQNEAWKPTHPDPSSPASPTT